jgi:hypothetical protein
MKRLLSLSKMLLATAALTVLVTSAVNAGGINLSWTDCGVFGAQQRNFACAANTGANTMVGSAISPVEIDQMVAMAAVLDLQTNQSALTPWWNFDVGCRAGALTADYNFLSSTGNCGDVWTGLATGGSNYISGFGSANRGRIRLVCAVAAPILVDNFTENYYFKVTYTNTKTTGTGSCAGCTDGACIVFNSIELDQQPGLGNTEITNPIDRNFIVWQAGGGSVAGGCPAAVPTRNSTWGSVKSLYR